MCVNNGTCLTQLEITLLTHGVMTHSPLSMGLILPFILYCLDSMFSMSFCLFFHPDGFSVPTVRSHPSMATRSQPDAQPRDSAIGHGRRYLSGWLRKWLRRLGRFLRGERLPRWCFVSVKHRFFLRCPTLFPHATKKTSALPKGIRKDIFPFRSSRSLGLRPVSRLSW